MPCPWRTSDLVLLLSLTIFVAEVEGAVQQSNSLMSQTRKDNSTLALNSSCTNGKETTLNNSVPPTEVDIPLFVLMNSKAVLCCPPVSRTYMIGATWEIILRDKPACIKAYKADSNETKDVNCTDRRITWVSRPDQNLSLRIDPVSITHDGDYKCEIAASEGNFQCGYHLQVLVPPEVTLVSSKNRTATCKAAGAKPAAQISWTPEGHCITEQEHLDNGTVTVQSTCLWSDSNVSAVTCSVSHLAGNKTLSEELNPGANASELLGIPYIILCTIVILIIMGFMICFLKTSGCRLCKLKKTEVTSVVEEDEMQPYASYTERNNPLYDTTNKVKMSQGLQSAVDGVSLWT
ncbi:cell surface glycoprotein CD200 receptor 1 isoform X3 [Tupaia chinensis]|uniref:cell surface glycoprotein CD200 receptor 1 isoform X3 n=1 Tax=Tupaia chinensis TaxID=246437 RepID=UPI00070405BB|nr:cell surface glycoprotein CD200 receptor 1 isoform X3 [Tupaia chinensis]